MPILSIYLIAIAYEEMKWILTGSLTLLRSKKQRINVMNMLLFAFNLLFEMNCALWIDGIINKWGTKLILLVFYLHLDRSVQFQSRKYTRDYKQILSMYAKRTSI